MTSISWKDEYLINIPSVDHEHQQLIALINEVLAQLRLTQGGPNALDCLGELHANIAAHFALEEKVMADHHYDEFASHKADHERLLDDIHDLMEELDEAKNLDLDNFSERLSNWFNRTAAPGNSAFRRLFGGLSCRFLFGIKICTSN